MIWRIGSISAVFSLLLFGFGGFLVYSVRRRGQLRERLGHARQLARLHAKSDAILDAIPIAVAVVDEDRRVTQLNAEMAELVGEQARGEKLEDLWREAADTSFSPIAQAVERGAGGRGAEPIVLEPIDFGDGPRHLQFRAVALSDDADEESMILAFDDVTRVRQLESQLLRAEKLATVGTLAAGVAHEIGTPLGVVRGRAEYALSKFDDDDPRASHLEVIVDQVDYVSGIVRQILDFSREDEPEVRATDLERRVEEALQLVSFQPGEERSEILVDFPDDLAPLAANPDELQQVLVNLLVNADQACKGQGTIELEAGLEETGAEGPMVRVVVRDDGEGIAPEQQREIFDPFFTTKKRGKGTGLGLSIVQQIVRNHGGTIHLTSRPGVGTQFTVRWPVWEEGRAESDGDEAASDNFSEHPPESHG